MLNMNSEMVPEGVETALIGWLGCAEISSGALSPLHTFARFLCPTDIRDWA